MGHGSCPALAQIRFILAPSNGSDYNGNPIIGLSSHIMMRTFLVVITVAGMLTFVAPFVTVGGETREPVSLWRAAMPVATTDQSPVQRKPWVLREREITVDIELLQILKDASARPHPRVTVEFFDGNRHELDITSTVSRFNDTSVIRGSFKPPSRGDFTLVATGNLLVGSLQAGD